LLDLKLTIPLYCNPQTTVDTAYYAETETGPTFNTQPSAVRYGPGPVKTVQPRLYAGQICEYDI